MITYGLIAAAVALYLWPTGSAPSKPRPVIDLDLAPPVVVPRILPSYEDSIRSLAAVRARLNKTEKLGEKESEAINAITLALVAGSDDK